MVKMATDVFRNRKGSPKKLGRPNPGEIRTPTVSEEVSTSLKASDLIHCSLETGKLKLIRCIGNGRHAKYMELPDIEAAPLLDELRVFWAK
jgi:hypothetical protein